MRLTALPLMLFGLLPAALSDASPGYPPVHSPDRTLTAFGSEAEFLRFLERHAPAAVGRREGLVMEAAPAAMQMAPAAAAVSDAAESVTNVQHAGVDEGGIVKVHGDHLVILRRGRLFTVAIGDRELRPVSAVDAFGPDVNPARTWYDELIVYRNVVVVVGYSYARGGTEVGLFDIDARGRLRHRSTDQLRSSDYYSSRNYASRLVGSRLVFYAPVPFPVYGGRQLDGLPAMRRWSGEGGTPEFQRILPADRVYHAGLPPSPGSFVLHTVTTCDLASADLRCDASAVVGPHGRVFYVSPGSVYIWTSGWWQGGPGEPRPGPRAESMLYRMPLDGSAPSALRVSGSPVDPFSFLEGDDGHLNVVVRSAARGDGMWGAERARGDVSLLRIPLDRFSDGQGAAPESSYRSLPTPPGHTFQNRFVGDHLLYGTGSGWGRYDGGRPDEGVYVVPVRGRGFTWLPLEHGVDRIEVLGTDAVVVGSGADGLHFTSVGLERGPAVKGHHMMAGAAQGELRSHGFFYRADDPDSGLLGLPVRSADQPGSAHLREGSAGVVFLRNQAGHFEPLGRLDAAAIQPLSDGCQASCVDWYGNARPLFLRGRVFALLGYEIVEGLVDRDRIQELRRVDMARAIVAEVR